MFSFLRDNGDKRTFEYVEELKQCPSGKVIRVAAPGTAEEIRLVLSETFQVMSDLLASSANEQRRHGPRIIDDADPFGPIASGC